MTCPFHSIPLKYRINWSPSKHVISTQTEVTGFKKLFFPIKHSTVGTRKKKPAAFIYTNEKLTEDFSTFKKNHNQQLYVQDTVYCKSYLKMKVMTCNLAEIILRPSTESFSGKKNKSITCSSYWYNFKQFPWWDLLFKKFIPAKEYLQIEILNAFAWILTQAWKKRKTVTQIFSNALPDSVRSDFGKTLRVQWKSSDGQNIQASHLPIYIVSSRYERSLTTVWFYTSRTIYYKLQENCC